MTRPTHPPPARTAEFVQDRHVAALAGKNLKKLKRQAARERGELALEAAGQVIAVPAFGQAIYSMADEPLYACVGFVHDESSQVVMVAAYGQEIAPMYAIPLSSFGYDQPIEGVHDGRWRLRTTSRVIGDQARPGLVVVDG